GATHAPPDLVDRERHTGGRDCSWLRRSENSRVLVPTTTRRTLHPNDRHVATRRRDCCRRASSGRCVVRSRSCKPRLKLRTRRDERTCCRGCKNRWDRTQSSLRSRSTLSELPAYDPWSTAGQRVSFANDCAPKHTALLRSHRAKSQLDLLCCRRLSQPCVRATASAFVPVSAFAPASAFART